MGQEKITKRYSTFVRGLITEASAVNFPEDASVDEDNMHLHRDGSRERRLGINYESGYAKNSNSLLTDTKAETSFYSWNNVGKESNKSFLVSQVGKHIDIFESANGVYGSRKKRYEISVDTTSVPHDGGPLNRPNHPFSFTTANGVLYCAQKTSKPFYIEYDDEADDFTVTAINLQVRDIWGVPLGVATSITDRPTTLSGTDGWLHRYNLANQGWPDEDILMSATSGTPPVSGASALIAAPIDQTITDLGYAPSLADSFYSSHGLMNSGVSPANVGVYRPDMLTTNPLLSLRMPRGKFIIDAFIKDRSAQTSLVFSGTESQDTGSPSLVESFAGRIWYSGIDSSQVTTSDFDDGVKYNSTLFFSQILETLDHAGKCYQENDPTSEVFSDILDTDGGTVELAGAGKIQKLIPLHNFLVVLADNGIWTVTGGQGGFTASSYSVRKVSNIGCVSSKSVVEVEGSVVYWSLSGIYSLAVDPTSQDIRTQNITENTIQTLYQDIPDIAKKYAQGFFDAVERRVSWLYTSDSTFDGVTGKWERNKELFFDLVLKAWSVYTISPLASNTPYVIGAVLVPAANYYTQSTNVVNSGLEVVASEDQVVADISLFSTQAAKVVYICQDASGQYTFGGYTSTTFLDWYNEDSVGVDYTSYLITGYENLDDTARRRQAVYLTAHFERTEDNFISDGAGGAILDNQSGCTLQARWDWSDHADSGKWGSSQDIYRLRKLYSPSGTLPEVFNNGYPVTTTKNKLRGSGLSSHLKFTSETGKDMHLLGWQIEYKGGEKV